MSKPTHRGACALDQLGSTVDACLQQWGRYSYPHYDAFQNLVDLELAIVEKRAREDVRLERLPRSVNNLDRQYAAWHVLKNAIDMLCPRSSELSLTYRRALEKIPETGWPPNLMVPQELYFYLVLYLAYVAKSYDNRRLAQLFKVAPRTLADIRNDAIKAVAMRLYEWEQRSSLPHRAA